MTTSTPAVQEPVLTSADRCDRCQAQAYVLVRLPSGQALQFCVHHYTAHSKVLADISSEIVDESARLLRSGG